MKRLICLLFAVMILLAGCVEKPKYDAGEAVSEVALHVIDGEETVCGEVQTQGILQMYAECKNFKRNRDNAGCTPPKPVEIIIRYENGQSITIYHPGTHKIGIRDANGDSWFAENEELYAYLTKLQEEELARQEAESEKQAVVDAAENILYGELLSFLHHYIGYEEIERLQAERSGMSVITIPQGTELEFMPGCTMETTEDATVLALKYAEKYRLIIPWNFEMRVEHPNGLKKTEKGPGNTVVSPNTIYTPEEDVTWPVVQDEITEYLKVKELKIRKGSECRLDIGFEKGKAYFCSKSASLDEDEVAEARELKQEDLAVTWFDESTVEGYLPVPSGKVVYKLSETEDTASIWGAFTCKGIETVPKEWLLPLDFDVLEEKLPAGEYVFSTYGGGCASPPNWWLGLYQKDMTDEEMRGDAPYFFTAKG